MEARLTTMEAKMVCMQTSLEGNYKITTDTQKTILETLQKMVASQNVVNFHILQTQHFIMYTNTNFMETLRMSDGAQQVAFSTPTEINDFLFRIC